MNRAPSSMRPARPARRHAERGLTLVEMMVAITIGLFISLGLSAVFVNMKRAFNSQDALAQLQDHRMREALVDAIKVLPEREQFVMSMYYEQDMNLKEIAAVLKVTESRVCQLHSQSIARLRVKLRAY